MKNTYDVIIIGSGFGGSVSALRLVENGYRVLVIEQGKRYHPQDFPRTNWNFRKYFWMPKLALYGIQAMTLLKDVFILHGAGVGGGSLVYANNLLVPDDDVLNDPNWGDPDWKQTILPYYQRAKRMLGAVPAKELTVADQYLKECAENIGRGDTFHVNDVGVYFGEPDQTVPDPFFNGKGPERTGCTFCGGCMVGCRVGAKNTLDMNYLYLAEKLGVDILPEQRVIDVKPDENGSYSLIAERVTGLRNPRQTFSAKYVVFSGGVMGTVKLLLKLKRSGSLPQLSDQLGNVVRTNSEALLGTVAKKPEVDYSHGIAITSGIYPDDNTHIETVRYGAGQDAMALLTTPLVDGGRVPRPLRFLGTLLRHPLQTLKYFAPVGWAKRTTILLVMQKIDNYLRFDYRPRWWKLGLKGLTSNWNTEKKVPSYIPVANEFAQRMSEKMKGEAKSCLPEVMFNTSTTAHILGGCVMSDSPAEGVIDRNGQVHGYQNLYVIDGSIIPVNLGVNPSLTITAVAEYLMDRFPEK